MKRFSIIGSGQYNWDVIKLRDYPDGFVPGKRNTFTETILSEEVGGTCGNIMCALARLGWEACPQVKLIDSSEGRKLADSLGSYGCDLKYVSFSEKGGFSGITCIHRKNRATGMPEPGLRSFGPNNSRFRKITELRAGDEVPALLDSVTEAPDVYFFDHSEAGPRKIAEELRKRGSLIFYECENNRDRNKFVKSVRIADIVKFSDENVPDISFCAEFSDKLFIQTQGADGLQFSLRGGPWIHIPSQQTGNTIDTEGCGDTITAVFLDEIAKLGLPKISDLTEEEVTAALREATLKAALCAQHYGPKAWLKIIS